MLSPAHWALASNLNSPALTVELLDPFPTFETDLATLAFLHFFAWIMSSSGHRSGHSRAVWVLCSITASVLVGELKDAPGKDPSGGRAVLGEPEGSCGTRAVKQEGSGCYTSTGKAFAGCDSFILSTVTQQIQRGNNLLIRGQQLTSCVQGSQRGIRVRDKKWENRIQ